MSDSNRSFRIGSVTVSIRGIMGTSHDPGIEMLETDLLVVSAIRGGVFTDGVRKLDRQVKGALSRVTGRERFGGLAGERVLLDLGHLNLPRRYLLLLGIGDAETFDARVICDYLGEILRIATEKKLRKVTLAMMPNRATARQVNFKGTAATLRCRLEIFLASGEASTLEELELFCTPQAARFLAAGLSIPGARCGHCPLLPTPDGQRQDPPTGA